MVLEQGGHPLTIGKVELDEMEIILSLQLRKAGFLERNIVIVVEIVEADYLIAALEQPFGEMKSDKTGRAGHQNFCHSCLHEMVTQ